MEQIRHRYIRLAKPDPDTRTVEASLSSETPTPMFGRDEILDHSHGAVDIARAKDGLPLLFSHQLETPIGVVENVRLEGRKLRGTLRFGTSAKANEIFNDVDAGILKNLSIGYRVKAAKPNGEAIRVTQWELLEASIVSVPADHTVGIGRTFNPNQRETKPMNTATKTVNIDQGLPPTERERCIEISAMCRHHKLPDTMERELLESGASIDTARQTVLDLIIRRARAAEVSNLVPASALTDRSGEIGLTDREARRFSIVRAINAACDKDWRGAGFERECSDAVAKRVGKQPTNGFFVPYEALNVRSAYSTASSGTGGALVAQNLAADSFIDVLHNKTQVLRMGAQILSGLVGNVDIPRRATTTPAYWLAEGADITEGEGTFDKISLTPKTLACLSTYSRNMLLQSTPDIESVVRQDLAGVLAVGTDLAAIAGTGASNQPRGILNTSGVGSVAGGTNGAALTLDHLISLAAAVEGANANGPSCGFLLNSASVAALSRLKDTAGQYLWQRGTNSPSFGPIAGQPDAEGFMSALGYRLAITNQLPGNLTKGTGTNLSALIFGNWADLVIGEWSTLEIIANPFGAGFASGSVQIRAMQTIDIGIRHPASFATMLDAATS